MVYKYTLSSVKQDYIQYTNHLPTKTFISKTHTPETKTKTSCRSDVLFEGRKGIYKQQIYQNTITFRLSWFFIFPCGDRGNMQRKPEGRLPALCRRFQIIPMLLFIPRPLNAQ